MRRYLITALLLVMAVSLIGMGTFAKWSDKEDAEVKAPTGVIKIDLKSPANGKVELSELKPCWWREAKFTLVPGCQNGRKSNPGELYVHLKDLKVSNYGICGLEGEAAGSEASMEGWCPPPPPLDICDYLEFDLKYRVKGGSWEVKIPQDKPVPIKSVKCQKIRIGSLPDEVEVVMSFHLKDNTPITLGGKVVTAEFEFILDQESTPTP